MDERRNSNRPVAVEGPDGKPMFYPAFIRDEEGKIALHPKTGEPIPHPRAGEPVYQMIQRGGTSRMASARARRSITGWTGVVDADDKQVKFSVENVMVLWDGHLDVKLPHCVMCGKAHEGGEDHPALHEQSYGAYITDRLTDPKTFDPDPSTIESASPST